MSKQIESTVYLVDCSELDYAARLTCVSIQGLLNRETARVYLDYGYYDKLSDRTTTEEFISDELWFGKFRQMVGRQDRRNLAYYQDAHGIEVQEVEFPELLRKFRPNFKGAVIWDENLIETVSLAVMLSGQNNLLILSAGQSGLAEEFDLEIHTDLRNRWQDRLGVYQWALDNLFETSKPGYLASLEPGWRHPEFLDYVIRERIFTYSLATYREGKIFGLGLNLLLLLFAGPRWLRNLIFGARLDGLIKSLARGLMHSASPETRLATKIQRRLPPKPFPTIFGWHTLRDSEMTFMLHLSMNDLRLVPSHMASNFSFHSQVPPLSEGFKQHHIDPHEVRYDPGLTYLTFTLSDGDQLMMMSTNELGNWMAEARGQTPFNWETQPLLVELAPALLEKYYRTATELDCLVAGPSGAGYIIQPLNGKLGAYLAQTERICQAADIDVITSYDPAPARRVLDDLLGGANGVLGYLGGYLHFGAFLQEVNSSGTAFVTHRWPPLEGITASAEETLAGVKALLESDSAPRFIGVHLFAYRTSLADVLAFVRDLDPQEVKVVRGDEFLILARQRFER